jgi:hypothetical protein
VLERADCLEDRPMRDISADSERRLEAEQDHEDRGHQRAPAHTGDPDERSDQRTGERQLPPHG